MDLYGFIKIKLLKPCFFFMKGMGDNDEGHLDMCRCSTRLMSCSSSCLWVVQLCLWFVLLFAVCSCI